MKAMFEMVICMADVEAAADDYRMATSDWN